MQSYTAGAHRFQPVRSCDHLRIWRLQGRIAQIFRPPRRRPSSGTTSSTAFKFPIRYGSVIKQKLISFAIVDFPADRHKFDPEAKASTRQQVRLLTTALLKEVRASTSVGGGGRGRWSRRLKREARVERGAEGTLTEELGKPSERYAKGSPIPRVLSGLAWKAGRKASRRGKSRECNKAELPTRPSYIMRPRTIIRGRFFW